MNKYIFTLIALLISVSQICAQKQNICEKLKSQGLVNVEEEIPGIGVYLVYSTPYNFMGKVLYNGLDKAFLCKEAAVMLNEAVKYLKQKRMDLHLVVYDAARPVSIQKEMWKVVEGTDLEDFVANPNIRGGGPHNYGIAVDVTLYDCTNHPVPMGSEYDYFGDRARVDKEEQLIANGEITRRELLNRKLLREVMTHAGFISEPSEWWHFNAMPTKVASQKLKVIE